MCWRGGLGGLLEGVFWCWKILGSRRWRGAGGLWLGSGFLAYWVRGGAYGGGFSVLGVALDFWMVCSIFSNASASAR